MVAEWSKTRHLHIRVMADLWRLPMKGSSRAGRVVCLAGVALLHGALFWWWRAPALSPNGPSLDRMVVRLIPVVTPAHPVAVIPAQHPVLSAPRVARSSSPTPAETAGRRSVESSSSPQATLPASPAEESAPAAQRPLDLTVHAAPHSPRPATAALIDPRSNSHKPSLSEALAQHLGSDDRRYEEVRPDGSIRIRQGTSCLDARLSRAAELDPFRGAERPAPRQITSCN